MTRHIYWLAASLLGILAPAVCAGEESYGPLAVTVGRSIVLDTPADLLRVSVANGDVAEALAVSPREVLVNGKAPGRTSLILWLEDGTRSLHELVILRDASRSAEVGEQIQQVLEGQAVSLDVQNDSVFLKGTVRDVLSAERAASMAATLGKVVNLLRVETPPTEYQILLHVRFADVDRAATTSLGFNLLSTGAGNTFGQITTGQFGPAAPNALGNGMQFSLSDALNVFLFRRDLNLGTLIKALEARNLLQMLAEPNLLALNGKPASFVAGGEFPFPVVQGGSAAGSVTIQFREYGVRINFLPTVTPRGSIRLQVAPEVSSLDYSNALQFEGYTIPALATRRVQTQVELESGQSFVIAGLLDNTITESLNKIPGIGDIPLFGKLFQSRTRTRNNSELMVLITPELVLPIPEGAQLPEVRGPEEFLPGTAVAPRTLGEPVTGTVPRPPIRKDVRIEELLDAGRQKVDAPVLPQTPASSVGGIR